MKNKGFSLVELIVVIAIMAILVGVAVPVYTSYIDKANKSKDIQLVDEVAHALQVYSAGNPNGSGWVVLTPDGAVGDGAFGAAAVKEAFGDNWAEDLELSWDGWVTTTDFLDMTAEQAATLLGSSYITGSDATELLGEVSHLTNAAFGMIGDRADDPELLYSAMTRFFDETLIQEYFEVGGEAGSEKFVYTEENKAEFQTQLSNFLVLAVAETMANADPEGSDDELVNMIGGYAMANAFANSEYAKSNPAIGEAYEALKAEIATNMTPSGAQTAIGNFMANPEYEEELRLYMGASMDGKAADDVAAFQNMMNSLAQLKTSGKLTGEDLKNANLYTDGAVADYFNSYIATAGLVTSLDATQVAALKTALTENPGSIAVYVSGGVVACTEDEFYK